MHRSLIATLAGVAAAATLSACAGSSPSGATSPGHGPEGKPLRGGTAYFSEQPLTPPNYIFPLISGQYYSVANTAEFQTLMYRPLYWYGNGNRPGVNYNLSLAEKPLYSDHDTVVTITMHHAKWSDGETVTARDVGFWINLLKANRADWASYVPGGFPDNVISWSLGPPQDRRVSPSTATITLKLDRAYNPTWFTGNELSQITPLPLAWDRISGGGRAPLQRGAAAQRRLPDTTGAGSRAVYRYLNSQAKSTSSYATSPTWSVVDGAWKLQQLTPTGQATFVPNSHYDGPDKPHLKRFVELPFTSAESEFDVLRAGSATGNSSSDSPQISAGYVPDTDVPQAAELQSQGYRLVRDYEYGFDYFEPNFNNPTVGPILRQLYFRQALEHLVNQPGWIRAYYGGLAVPTYSPVPAKPDNPYSTRQASLNPYPYSVAAAKRLLSSHGWKVVANGTTTCTAPGTASGECGAGIPAGKALNFTLAYPSGLSYADGAMTNLQSDAKLAGIEIALKQVTTSTIDAEVEPCKPHQAACSWELGQYGAPWVFAPDHYPTGEEIFQTGALGNVGSYSNATVDRLIKATTQVGPARSQQALNAYASAVRKLLPDFWQPSPGMLLTAQSNLGGFVPNAYGFISPEQWYFVK